MPFYQYQCKNCQHQFEELQGIHDDPLKDCPACNQPELNKMITTFGMIVHKGTSDGFIRNKTFKEQ